MSSRRRGGRVGDRIPPPALPLPGPRGGLGDWVSPPRSGHAYVLPPSPRSPRSPSARWRRLSSATALALRKRRRRSFPDFSFENIRQVGEESRDNLFTFSEGTALDRPRTRIAKTKPTMAMLRALSARATAARAVEAATRRALGLAQGTSSTPRAALLRLCSEHQQVRDNSRFTKPMGRACSSLCTAPL